MKLNYTAEEQRAIERLEAERKRIDQKAEARQAIDLLVDFSSLRVTKHGASYGPSDFEGILKNGEHVRIPTIYGVAPTTEQKHCGLFLLNNFDVLGDGGEVLGTPAILQLRRKW